MSKRKLVCYVVFGATALTMAGVGAYTKRANFVRTAAAAGFGDAMDGPQVANRAAKGARLSVPVAPRSAEAAPPPEQPAYVVASLDPNTTLARPLEPVTPAAPEAAPAEAPPPAPQTPPPQAAAPHPAPPAAEPKHGHPAAAAAPHESHEKPKRPAAAGLLDEGQIAGLKSRLRLTPDQMEYWPAVEVALREVVRSQLHASRQARGGRISIDVNSPEVQKLIWAAMPLLMRLREDQKGEVRKLARVIGLEQVASQI